MSSCRSVAVAQCGQNNVQKIVLHMQSCCFDNLNLFNFFVVPVAVAVAIVTSLPPN